MSSCNLTRIYFLAIREVVGEVLLYQVFITYLVPFVTCACWTPMYTIVPNIIYPFVWARLSIDQDKRTQLLLLRYATQS
jgi:hypothetical protein